MKLVTGEEMRLIDRIAIEEYGIPEILLMEAAGNAVAEELENEINHCSKNKIVIICGRGNNGGDGFVAARRLFMKGYRVKVYLLSPIEGIQGAAKTNLDILLKLDCPMEAVNTIDALRKEAPEADILVDCILGTGLEGEVGPLFAEAIEIINSSPVPVISVDIPSGAIADNGGISQAVVKANKTICLQLPKLGNMIYPAAEYNGELIIREIGIPFSAFNRSEFTKNLITKESVKEILPQRLGNTHKGTYGNAILVAGSAGMTGAAILSANAAMRVGAGIVRLAAPEGVNSVLESRLTEVITIPLRETKKGYMGIEDIDKVTALLKISNAIAIGPGSGTTLEIENLLRNVLEVSDIPVVIDADGLNVLAQKMDLLSLAVAPVILTPHPKEFSRLTGLSVEEINRNRIETAVAFAKKWGVHLILKGARTVVAYPNGEVFINNTGNPGMATAGSGDVLTGMLAGLLAQGIAPERAALAAVYLHGKAGDFAAADKGEYSVVAGDIVEAISTVMKELHNGSRL